MQLVGDIKGDARSLWARFIMKAEKDFRQDFVWPGSGEVTFTGGGTAHHFLRQHRRQIQGFAQNGGFCRKRIERDAHVVVDELNADPPCPDRHS
ncbi:hypothetical protein ACLK19_26200 [Escherichia coli]